ncbi:hypothetical protein Tco_0247639 [Tanacetum coccineum]
MPAQSATQYWQPDTSSQPGSYYSFGRMPSHMDRQNLQTTIETHDDVDDIFYQNIPNRGRRKQFPSKYKLTLFMEQPPNIILPKERVNKTKNKGKKANLSPLNLGGDFEDGNVEENNVTFLSSQFTGNFLMYENVDPSKRNMPAARLTPDDNEARSDWWISSRAYFDGFIGQFDEQKREIERNKKEVHDIKEEMRKFREEMKVQSVRQENKEPIIADQHYGLSDFSQFQSMQGGPSSFPGHVNSSYFNMGTPPNFQTPMSSQPGSSVWQRQIRVPSHMGRQNLQTTIETHDDVDGIFDQGKKANLSPLNLGGAFEDDNVEENNVTFLGSQITGNFIMYENMDPAKVRRGNYVNLPAFLNDPHQVYLDCYMKGYIVPVSFWHQLVPHFCMPDMHRLSHDTPIGWLSEEHINSWMKLIIRRRAADAKWTMAYTSTISVHPEIRPVVRGNTQQFFERIRNDMCESFYMCRCEDTRECGYD